jgi:hypothetical protein
MKVASDYEGLLLQFNALRTILSCKKKEIEVYQKRIQEFRLERLIELEAELESEKEMNSILTQELENKDSEKNESFEDSEKKLVISTYVAIKMRYNKLPYGIEYLNKLADIEEQAERFYKSNFKKEK